MANSYPDCGERTRTWAPIKVGAIDPVGMTKPSSTYERKAIAMANATMRDWIVSTDHPAEASEGA
jgi:hypothetical protein